MSSAASTSPVNRAQSRTRRRRSSGTDSAFPSTENEGWFWRIVPRWHRHFKTSAKIALRALVLIVQLGSRLRAAELHANLSSARIPTGSLRPQRQGTGRSRPDYHRDPAASQGKAAVSEREVAGRAQVTHGEDDVVNTIEIHAPPP